MPLPFEFEGKGVLFEQFLGEFDTLKRKFVSSEPTSILDYTFTTTTSSSSSSPPTSSSTGTSNGSGVAVVSGHKWAPENQETSSSNVVASAEHLHPFPVEISAAADDTAAGSVEDWESDGHEQSILRWIMGGDVENPSMGLSMVISAAAGGSAEVGLATGDLEFNNFGILDHGLGFYSNVNNPVDQFPNKLGSLAQILQQNPIFSIKLPLTLSPQPQFDVKPQSFNPQLLVNQHQSQNPTQNPAFFMPLPYQNQETHLLAPPPPKRHNRGGLESNSNSPKDPFLDQGLHPNPLNLLPHYLQQKLSPDFKRMGMEDEPLIGFLSHPEQQGIIDQLFKAADLVQSGSNPILAQGILAQLNHQLSPIGKPFHRAAFYFKEAFQSLLHCIVNNMNPPQTSSISSPFSLIFKIAAYKLFSEVSPIVQFANFTCNQVVLEILDGFDQIHVIDFDIGYGGQWASLMQELALRGNGAPSLKITAFASPSTHDQLELGLTRENLCHFAGELNMAFEFEIVNLDGLTSSSWSARIHVLETCNCSQSPNWFILQLPDSPTSGSSFC